MNLNPPVSLTKVHRTAGFDCSVDSLNEWLIRRALKNEYSGGSRTYVVCDEDRVIGYYAISTGSIAHRVSPGRVKRNMPDPIPVLVLGRLAVDHRFQGKGIGRGLLKSAIVRSLHVASQVGTRALVVHALNDSAELFYVKHGFLRGVGIDSMLFLALR